MDEFDLINRYFAPLALDAGADELKDDVATIGGFAITKDVLVEGVHFRTDDPLDLVARKALRVNISDLVAKGVRPTAYLLGMTWPKGTTEDRFALFTKGLNADQKEYGLTLLGGDTTRHGSVDGPLTISVTMLGSLGDDRPIIRRKGASPGDIVLMTGAVGDAGLGLAILKDEWQPQETSLAASLVSSYQLPAPPITLAPVIRQYATASLDVSDGLMADAGHLAKASGVGILLSASSLPLSKGGEAYVSDGHSIAFLAACGDDYQTLFTCRQADYDQLKGISAKLGIRLTRIGQCVEGRGVTLNDDEGQAINISTSGYSHF